MSAHSVWCMFGFSAVGNMMKVLRGHQNWVYCSAFSPDSSVLCSVGAGKAVCPSKSILLSDWMHCVFWVLLLVTSWMTNQIKWNFKVNLHKMLGVMICSYSHACSFIFDATVLFVFVVCILSILNAEMPLRHNGLSVYFSRKPSLQLSV